MHTKEHIKNEDHANKGKRDPNDLGRSPNPLASPWLHKVSSATQWDTTQKNQRKFLTSEQNHFPISCTVNNDNQILQLNLLSNFSFKTFQCEHSSRTSYFDIFLWYKGLTKKLALKNMITKIALECMQIFLLAAIFLALNPLLTVEPKFSTFNLQHTS
jgi:hypothetical protein